MRRVGVREFRDHATQYLAADEVVAIERHGRTVGFYIPTGTSREESFARALERLAQIVEGTMAEAGLSEEELSQMYDLAQPLTNQPQRRAREVAPGTHASGR